MICKIQVIIIGEDGLEETRELACLERTDLKPETLADELLVPWNVLRPFKGSEIEFDNDEPSGCHLAIAFVGRLSRLGSPPAAFEWIGD